MRDRTNVKMCKDCGVRPVRPQGSAKSPFCRCNECQRKYKRESMQKLRAEKAKLLMDDPVKKMKRCTKCNKLKHYSAFSPSKIKLSGELNKLCDACLTKLYMSQNKYAEGFTAEYWRRRAYSVNTSHRQFLAKKNGVPQTEIQFEDMSYVCKPNDLVEIYNRQNGKCAYCGVELTTSNLEIDHKIPKSRNGSLELSNLCACCTDCNVLKLQKTDKEFLEDFIPEYISRFINRAKE